MRTVKGIPALIILAISCLQGQLLAAPGWKSSESIEVKTAAGFVHAIQKTNLVYWKDAKGHEQPVGCRTIVMNDGSIWVGRAYHTNFFRVGSKIASITPMWAGDLFVAVSDRKINPSDSALLEQELNTFLQNITADPLRYDKRVSYAAVLGMYAFSEPGDARISSPPAVTSIEVTSNKILVILEGANGAVGRNLADDVYPWTLLAPLGVIDLN